MRACSLFRFVLIELRHWGEPSAVVWIAYPYRAAKLNILVLSLVFCLVLSTCFVSHCICAVVHDRCWFCCSVLTATEFFLTGGEFCVLNMGIPGDSNSESARSATRQSTSAHCSIKLWSFFRIHYEELTNNKYELMRQYHYATLKTWTR